MARFIRAWLILFVAVFSIQSALSVDPPEISPSPPPELGSDSVSPPPEARPPSTPPPLPASSSPPAPPPSDQAPASPPAPPPAPEKKTPVPAPSFKTSRENVDADETKESSSGLTSGQKAGIAVGVIAGACIVGFVGILFKKRQQNIRRSEYGYAARGEIL